MLAVIVTGGKQYKVQKDQVVQVERLKAAEGDSINFDQIVLVQDGENILVGKDLATSVVKATVLAHTRGAKISVVKFKRRKRYLRQHGHKQHYTNVKIDRIDTAIMSAANKKAESKQTKAKN